MKTTPIDYLDEMPEPDISTSFSYVKNALSEEPYGNLLWLDIRNAMKKGKLTILQQTIFSFYIRGLSEYQIATILGRSRSTIRNSIAASKNKLTGIEMGTLTALVEGIGWSAAKEFISGMELDVN
jgi:DNA-binding CsgD family transcriptional regulator